MRPARRSWRCLTGLIHTSRVAMVCRTAACGSYLTRATRTIHLNVRTGHRAIRTKDAAGTACRSQCLAAPLTEVNADSGVGRHHFDRCVPTVRTRDLRFQLDGLLCLFHSANTVMAMKMASTGSRIMSKPATQADRPTAPKRTTSSGVKQQIAATTVPTIPIERRRSADMGLIP